MTLFYYDISDYIDIVYITPLVYQNQNIGEVEEYGFELAASSRIVGNLSGGFNYTYLQYNNTTSPGKKADEHAERTRGSPI